MKELSDIYNLVTKNRLVAELAGVKDDIVGNAEELFRVAQLVADDMDWHVVAPIDHRWTPQGHTGGLILAESHFIWEVWPEHNHVSIDVYTCTAEFDSNKINNSMVERYQPTEIAIGTVPLPTPQLTRFSERFHRAPEGLYLP